MPDHDAESSALPESNTSSDPPAPSKRPRWGSEDRLQNLANLLAVVVALAAITLAVWQGYESRRFYRLSVLPHLDALGSDVAFDSPINSEYFSILSSLGVDSVLAVSYSLRNSGLGPAEIHRFIVFHDGKKIYDSERPDSTSTPYKAELRRVLGELPFPVSPFFGGASAGVLLQAGKVHPFLEVAAPFSGVENADSLDRSPTSFMWEALQSHSFTFCYCSVYGTDCDMVTLGSEPPVENVCGY